MPSFQEQVRVRRLVLVNEIGWKWTLPLIKNFEFKINYYGGKFRVLIISSPVQGTLKKKNNSVFKFKTK